MNTLKNSPITIDREIFHQMMRRLSGVGMRDFIGTSENIKLKDVAAKLMHLSAAKTNVDVEIVL